MIFSCFRVFMMMLLSESASLGGESTYLYRGPDGRRVCSFSLTANTTHPAHLTTKPPSQLRFCEHIKLWFHCQL
jgi:hypothetical protein